MRNKSLVLLSLMLALSLLIPVVRVYAQPNTWSIGVALNYSSGWAYIDCFFWNNGFTASNGNPEQIELTASTSQGFHQVAIWIYSSTNTKVDDEYWKIDANGNPYNVWDNQHQLNSAYHTWNTIALSCSVSSPYGVKYLVDGVVYDTVSSSSALTFDTQLMPSVTVESSDTTASDFSGIYITGVIRNYANSVHNPQPTRFYGGAWGKNGYGFYCPSQTTGVYVGSNPPLEAPSIVGVTGHNLAPSYWAAQYQFAIGNPNLSQFQITDPIMATDYSAFTGNAWGIEVS